MNTNFLQVIPPGTFKTINMCDYCKYDRITCKASCTYGEILTHMPLYKNERELFEYARKNIIACDKFRKNKI